MNPSQRKEVAIDIAGIIARGYDLHIDAHGPDDSHAVREPSGKAYHVDFRPSGAASYIVRDGEMFEVIVIGTGVRA